MKRLTTLPFPFWRSLLNSTTMVTSDILNANLRVLIAFL